MRVVFAGFIIIIILWSVVPVLAQWSEPINVGPPVNSATHELKPSLTPFSDMMVLETGRGDSSGLFTTHLVNGQWTELQYVHSIGNPSSWVGPALSPDGNEIYFSCLCGGYGDYDIWKVVFDSISGIWSDPINLGPNINDWGGQTSPFLSYNGQNLYFIDYSIRFEGVVVSHREGDVWSYPELVGGYFGSAVNASLTMDERMMYFGQAVPNEFWAVFYSEKDDSGNWTIPERFDEINNYGTPVYPRVNVDGSRIYFSSDMVGGAGGFDIWFVEQTTAMDGGETGSPVNNAKLGCYPNPFNSSTTVSYQISEISDITLEAYDILGRKIITESLPRQAAGNHKYNLDLGDQPSGVYFVRISSSDGHSSSIKTVLLK